MYIHTDTKTPRVVSFALQTIVAAITATLLFVAIGFIHNTVSAISYAYTQGDADSVVDGEILINVSEDAAETYDMEPGSYFLEEILREGDDHTATGFIFRADVSWGRDGLIRVPADNLNDIQYRRNFTWGGDSGYESVGATPNSTDIFTDLIASDELLNAEYAYFTEGDDLVLARRSEWMSDDLSGEWAFGDVINSGYMLCAPSELSGEEDLEESKYYFYGGPCSMQSTGDRVEVSSSDPGTGELHERVDTDDPWLRQPGTFPIANVAVFEANIDAAEEIAEDIEDFAPDDDEFDRGEGEVVDSLDEAPPGGPECVNEGGFMGFISCDVLVTVIGWIAGLQEAIARVLFENDPLTVGVTDDPRYAVWSTFRNIANGLLILAFMFVIFSLALSVNVDAYTVKKMVPRLLVAAIAIQASYFISALMIDATNILGAGINAVFNSAISEISINFGAGAAFGSDIAIIGIIGGAGAGLLLAAPSLMLIMLLLFLVILGALVIVALRDLFIIMCIVLSPFAFLANLLPSTERWYKFWWSNFLRLLMMYPFIVLMIQIGNLGSFIILSVGN